MLSIRSLLIAVAAVLLLSMPAQAAPATRTVGDRFDLTVQYMSEPVILGDTNGVRLQIMDGDEPVSGVASSVSVEVQFMEAVRVLNLFEDPAQPGVYTGVFIPMQTGEYSFRVSGAIDGVEFDETFGISDGLVAISPRSDFEFPNAANGFGPQELAVPVLATAVVGLVVLAVAKRSRA